MSDGEKSPGSVPAKVSFFIEIFTASMAAILLEIAYTRIFSFKVFYYFTYLIIGLGLLGIGTGGVAVAISGRIRRIDPAKLVPALSSIGALSIFAGYFLIGPTQINATLLTKDFNEVLKLIFVSLVLMVPFLSVGLIISTILGSARADLVGKLYGTDLIGAALGCVLVIPLLQWLDPPGTVMLSGFIMAAGGLRLGRRSKPILAAAAVATVLLGAFVVTAKQLPDPVVDRNKSLEDYKANGLHRFSKWNPVFRVDVVDHPFFPGEVFLLMHDGQPGSGLRRFDGSFKRFDYLATDSRSMPFQVVPKEPRVLIIGAAGGHEVVASLFFGASHVTGVELNPVTYSLLTDVYADLSGRLAENPKVTLLNGDGRWFLKQTDQKWDLIWFVAPDSYAAMNASTSGAFVLSESYLYTVEMLREGLKHLTDEGAICTQFGELDYHGKPNRTTRYLATAREAYRDLGIPNFEKHVSVGGAAGFPPYAESVVILGRSELTPERLRPLHVQTKRVKGGTTHYSPDRPPNNSPVNQVITMPEGELASWFGSHKYLVDPVRDNSPFFWHFVRYRDALGSTMNLGGGIVDFEDTIGEKITLIFLGVAVLLAGVFLLLPFFMIRKIWSEMPHKGNALVYFSALGLGFMFLEVAFIQKLTLFLGYPTYSLSVTLFAILVFSGLGSLLSGRFASKRNKALLVLFGVLVTLVAIYQFALPGIIDAFVGSSLALRVGLTVLLLAPVSFCLGSFMPMGLTAVSSLSKHSREYVAWAWAVNGFFSVIASILSTILGMVIGFRLLLLLSLVVYAVGVMALLRIPSSAKAAEA